MVEAVKQCVLVREEQRKEEILRNDGNDSHRGMVGCYPSYSWRVTLTLAQAVIRMWKQN